MGNTTVRNATVNVCKVLQLSGKEVPVFMGCAHSILEKKKGEFMSEDGLGNPEIGKTITGSLHCINE